MKISFMYLSVIIVDSLKALYFVPRSQIRTIVVANLDKATLDCLRSLSAANFLKPLYPFHTKQG